MSENVDEQRVWAVVLGRVQEATVRIILGPGVGQLDGGIPIEVPLALVPIEMRIPNSEIEVVFERTSRAIVAVRRRSEQEV